MAYLLDPMQDHPQNIEQVILETLTRIESKPLGDEEVYFVQEKLMQWLIKTRNFKQAAFFLDKFHNKTGKPSQDRLYFYQVCLIGSDQGFDIAKKLLTRVKGQRIPQSFALIDSYLSCEPQEQKKREQELFFFEKCKLYEQLFFLYHSAGQDKEAKNSIKKRNKEFAHGKATFPHA